MEVIEVTTCQVRASSERAYRTQSAWANRLRHVVVGVDGSPNSIEALRVAVRLARPDNAHVDVVTAYQPYPPAHFAIGFPDVYASPGGVLDAAAEAQATLERAVHEAVGDQPPNLVLRAVEGGAFEVLTRLAETADMLVIGARGYSGPLAILLGSTAQACVRHARCPVLVVPAPREATADDAAAAEAPTVVEAPSVAESAEQQEIVLREPVGARAQA
jgi:nucleotide-binding universal stress UspA family protein